MADQSSTVLEPKDKATGSASSTPPESTSDTSTKDEDA